jgi:hypothetical protein
MPPPATPDDVPPVEPATATAEPVDRRLITARVALTLVLAVVMSAPLGAPLFMSPEPASALRAAAGWPAIQRGLQLRIAAGEAQVEAQVDGPILGYAITRVGVLAINPRKRESPSSLRGGLPVLVDEDSTVPVQYYAVASLRTHWPLLAAVSFLALGFGFIVSLICIGRTIEFAAAPVTRSRNVELLLIEDLGRIERSNDASGRRALGFLLLGVFMAVLGVIGAGIVVSLLNELRDQTAGEWRLARLTALGALVFVEAVAWFLLRQYRAHIDDTRRMELTHEYRLNQLLALRVLADGEESGRLRPLVEALLRPPQGLIGTERDLDPEARDQPGLANAAIEGVRAVVGTGTPT